MSRVAPFVHLVRESVAVALRGNAVYRLWPQLDRWLAPRSV